MSKVDLSKMVEVIRMAIGVPDPLRQVLDWRLVQQFVPSFPGLWLPLFLLCDFNGCTIYLKLCLIILLFVLHSAHSLLPPLATDHNQRQRIKQDIIGFSIKFRYLICVSLCILSNIYLELSMKSLINSQSKREIQNFIEADLRIVTQVILSETI